MDAGLLCYPMGGTIDGARGDHVLLAPPFIISDDELDLLIRRLTEAVNAWCSRPAGSEVGLRPSLLGFAMASELSPPSAWSCAALRRRVTWPDPCGEFKETDNEVQNFNLRGRISPPRLPPLRRCRVLQLRSSSALSRSAPAA